MKLQFGIINIDIENNITFAFNQNKTTNAMEITQTKGVSASSKISKRCKKALELLLSHPCVTPTTSKILDPHSRTAPYRDNRNFLFLFYTRNQFFIQVYYTDLAQSEVKYYFVDYKKKQCYEIQKGNAINLNEKTQSQYNMRWQNR